MINDLLADSHDSDTWRIEVMKRGKYYQWRKGTGKARQCRYGGKFSTLPEKVQSAYWQRVRRKETI